MFKFLYWLYSVTVFTNMHGVQSTMSQKYDTKGVYDYKVIDTATVARIDSCTLYAPTPTNVQSIFTVGLKKTATNIDTVKVYINGNFYTKYKLENGVEKVVDIYFQPSKSINPNKVVIKWLVNTGGAPTRTVYVRPFWVSQ